MITHSLSKTIRNTILNYKDTVNDIVIDDEVSFTTNSVTCDCSSSEFYDKDHNHIITGDLRIIKNSKLRKLLTKGPNYRESRGIDFEKGLKYINLGLNEFVDKICSKNKNLKTSMSNWKNNVLKKLKNKINTLTRK